MVRSPGPCLVYSICLSLEIQIPRILYIQYAACFVCLLIFGYMMRVACSLHAVALCLHCKFLNNIAQLDAKWQVMQKGAVSDNRTLPLC